VGAGIVDLIVACGLKRRGFFSKECCFRERDNITAQKMAELEKVA